MNPLLALLLVVTSELPLQSHLMPDPNTNCSVRTDEATAYAICSTPWNGPEYRIDLADDGRPLLETRRPYTPPGGTYTEIVEPSATA